MSHEHIVKIINTQLGIALSEEDSATSVTYSGTAERTVGGITDGDTFSGATMQQMWDKLIKQEKFPTLTNPSSSFVASIIGYREVGEIININFNSSFNRGSINPQYTAASPYRAGLPNEYQYSGTGLINISTTNLTDTQSISGYTVAINSQNWYGRVAYDSGVQPKSSYDNDYNTPLSAGTTGYSSQTITGVYPFFATTVNITTLTKQTLTSMSSSYVQVTMVAEDITNKQKIEFPTAWATITGVQFFNTVSNTWEYINGTAANSLLTFTVTDTTENIQGNTINYKLWTHNGSQTGSRMLRFYTI